MKVTELTVKNFRCFTDITIPLDKDIVLIQGDNGSGKTTLLEALHYLCYLRSFRTYSPHDLLQFDSENFFLKVGFALDEPSGLVDHDLQVGYSGKKRLVKLNQKAIGSYKELMDYYRIVTLTEDDLALIKGSPEVRRTFVDQALILFDPALAQTMKHYKKVLENRNTLLHSGRVSRDSYELWTEQLWELSTILVNARVAFLQELESTVKQLLNGYFEQEISVCLQYKPKKEVRHDNFNMFMDAHAPGLKELELRYCRSMFGAHLDDFSISFQGKKSKLYASRGQQKLITLLIKIAQVQQLAARRGNAVFLLDDFMTDFDESRAERLLQVLSSLGGQLIFTSPARTAFFERKLLENGAQQILLTDSHAAP